MSVREKKNTTILILDVVDYSVKMNESERAIDHPKNKYWKN